ncbi:MAG: metallophosphoesterase family protein [Lachnospiraceae bacterium]|jgi:UDP-2,3-diacylglucosamine pyrophosphatase LpxH|nr:metallophosphoesterase family protein [Lachnospiraceae bacterium]
MSIASRLDDVYQKADRYYIDKNTRIVCMSDCHRGVGNHADNFLDNQNLFYAALEYYFDRQFVYMELGDGDELWENRSLRRIVETHDDSYWMLSQFYQRGRFHMLFGNHDHKKKNTRFLNGNCGQYFDDGRNQFCELLRGIQAKEGIVLTQKHEGNEILLVHGHQGSMINDTLWRLGRFLVRYFWKPLELIGVYDPTGAARNYREREKTEKAMDAWAKHHNVMVIAGHTHRPILPKPGTSLYLNDGSCVHPRCITALEIQDGLVTLVKWSIRVRHQRVLSVEREVLEGPIELNAYWKARK